MRSSWSGRSITTLFQVSGKSLFLVLGLLITTQGTGWAFEKHALIIANQDYEFGTALDNPINDSKALKTSLMNADFHVTVRENLGLDEMRRAIRDFAATQADTDNVAMIYYSGHGAEFGGTNYMIPVDAKLQDASKARFEALTLDDVQNLMHRDVSEDDRSNSRYQRGLNIIVLDACRNNPYLRKRGGVGGLSQVDGAKGTLIWYATQPRDVADDGANQSMSPFARAVSESIDASSGESVEDTFKQVALRTLDATGGEQHPWSAGSITGSFSFKPDSRPSTGRNVLSEFDPKQLDENILPFAPDNPLRISLKKFGKWNYGHYSVNGSEANVDDSFYFRFASFVNAFENVGPLTYASDSKATPVFWQELPNDFIASFEVDISSIFGGGKEPQVNLVVFSAKLSKVFASRPREAKIIDVVAIVMSRDGTELTPISSPVPFMQLYCRSTTCSGTNSKTRPAVFKNTFFAALSRGDYLLLKFLNPETDGINPGRESFKVPLAGLSEAVKFAIKTFRAPDNEATIFGRAFLDSDLTPELREFAGDKYTSASRLRDVKKGSPEEAYFAAKNLGAELIEKFIAKYGTSRSDKFAKLFRLLTQPLLDPKVCQTKNCLGGLSRGYGFLSSDGLNSWVDAYQELVPVTSKTQVAHDAAKKYVATVESIQQDKPTLLQFQIANTPGAYIQQFRNVRLIDEDTIVSFIRSYMKIHSADNSVLSYRELKSFVAGFNFSDEFNFLINEKFEAYLQDVRTKEHSELHNGALSECAAEENISPESAISCYREFASLFPESDQINKTNQIVLSLEQAQQCESAASTWKFLSKSTSISILESFASEHGTCTEAKEALVRIEELTD